jgi:hypothetical protein
MALANAFGFIDDPKEWPDNPDGHAGAWAEAASAARRVENAACDLADAAWRIARDMKEALPDE